VVLGDSLSAEYGLAHGQGWVALLEQQLKSQHRSEEVVNASISGDTTAGGRSRLPSVLSQHPPTLLVIELGGNDALRGLPLSATEDNLRAMVHLGQAAGAQVLLIGMQVPPNYGRAYSDAFAKLFAQVAHSSHSGLVPFLLKGVADTPDVAAHFQADGIHPLASEHPKMLANAWPEIQRLLNLRPK
jgi:acyl-CoA thioesterase-1